MLKGEAGNIDLTTNIVESTMRVIGLHTIIEGENTPSKREWREPQGDSQGRSEKENSDLNDLNRFKRFGWMFRLFFHSC